MTELDFLDFGDVYIDRKPFLFGEEQIFKTPDLIEDRLAYLLGILGADESVILRFRKVVGLGEYIFS